MMHQSMSIPPIWVFWDLSFLPFRPSALLGPEMPLGGLEDA